MDDHEKLTKLKQQAIKSTKAYDQRMKDRGFVKVHLWVPADQKEHFANQAEQARNESSL